VFLRVVFCCSISASFTAGGIRILNPSIHHLYAGLASSYSLAFPQLVSSSIVCWTSLPSIASSSGFRVSGAKILSLRFVLYVALVSQTVNNTEQRSYLLLSIYLRPDRICETSLVLYDASVSNGE